MEGIVSIKSPSIIYAIESSKQAALYAAKLGKQIKESSMQVVNGLYEDCVIENRKEKASILKELYRKYKLLKDYEYNAIITYSKQVKKLIKENKQINSKLKGISQEVEKVLEKVTLNNKQAVNGNMY